MIVISPSEDSYGYFDEKKSLKNKSCDMEVDY